MSQQILHRAPRGRVSHLVSVRHGERIVSIGGGRPVVVQSMTNTPTADVDATVEQVTALAEAGSELVRLTVNTPEAARAVVKIREALDAGKRIMDIYDDPIPLEVEDGFFFPGRKRFI